MGLANSQVEIIESFLNSTFDKLSEILPKEILEGNRGYQDILKLTQMLKENDIYKYCEFKPSIIRGFDYSDGLVYEVFDMNPANNRSMFGGERFDGLIKIFGDYELAATGFAMGDYTLLEFLKSWKLLPTLSTETKVLVTVFDEKFRENSYKLAQELRANGINSDLYLEPDKLDKQLKYADRKGIPFVIVQGPDEAKKGTVQLKDMKAKKQDEIELKAVVKKLKNT